MTHVGTRLGLATLLISAAAFANTVVYIGAHQDDWQLFMGSQASSDYSYGARIVFIYTTAGDIQTYPSPDTYWQAREWGALQSVFNLTGWSGSLSCFYQGVPGAGVGHPIVRCDYANTTTYFMRIYANGPLSYLRDYGTPAGTVDGSTTYESFGDFAQTLQSIVAMNVSGPMYINGPDDDQSRNPNDNIDHLATANAMVAAASGPGWPYIRYVDYQMVLLPMDQNVFDPQWSVKKALFDAYSDGVGEVYDYSAWNSTAPLVNGVVPLTYGTPYSLYDEGYGSGATGWPMYFGREYPYATP